MRPLKLLLGKRAPCDDDPADNRYSDDDDFVFRDRAAAWLAESRHRESDRGTVEEQHRESGDE